MVRARYSAKLIETVVAFTNSNGGTIPGSCGVPEDMIRKAVSLGVQKVNIDTDIRFAFTGAVRKHLAEHPAEFDPRKYLSDARALVQEVVERKIDVLGSAGSAG